MLLKANSTKYMTDAKTLTKKEHVLSIDRIIIHRLSKI